MNILKTKEFIFFNNFQTESMIKNNANKAYKSGEFNSHSSALNALSNKAFGKNFNKAKKDLKNKSPYSINDVLYLPLEDVDGNIYSVKVEQNAIKLTNELVLNFFDYMVLGKISFSTIEKIDKGWFKQLT